VRCSGGRDADIVVIPTASRLHETGHRYEKLFRDIGVGASTRWTSTRAATARSRAPRAPRGGDRHLLHRGQPAPADDAARRYTDRETHPTAQRPGSGGGRHQRRRELPLRAHDRLRRRGLLGHLRQRAPRARARAHQPLRDRPALPRARPPRAAAHRARLQPLRGGHRPRRGHGRIPSGPTRPWRSRAAEASQWWTRRRELLLHGQRHEGEPVCMLGLKLHILVAGATSISTRASHRPARWSSPRSSPAGPVPQRGEPATRRCGRCAMIRGK